MNGYNGIDSNVLGPLAVRTLEEGKEIGPISVVKRTRISRNKRFCRPIPILEPT